MDPGPPRRRRARPVADAPVDMLLGRIDDLAKGWLLALVEHAPLDQMPAILAADLATEGPRLCDAVVRALADDHDLRRLEPGGALELLAARAGELAGAVGSEATAAAVDALHEVVWSAVRDALRHPDPDQVAELAERLALVIGLVRAAALRGPGAAPTMRGSDAPPTMHLSEAAPATGPKDAPGGASREGYEPDPAADGPSVILVPSVERAAEEAPSAGAARTTVASPVADRERGRQALWVGALEEELARADRTGAQLSLLLAELEDADRVLAVEDPGEASATFGRFAQALRDAVRRQDILACESESRSWVIARDTGRAGAQALAGRIAATVSAAREWRGAPLSVTIGVAVLGEEGRDSTALIEAAEEARFAAAASGIAVVPSGSPPP